MQTIFLYLCKPSWKSKGNKNEWISVDLGAVSIKVRGEDCQGKPIIKVEGFNYKK